MQLVAAMIVTRYPIFIKYNIHRDKLDGKEWKRGELGESFDYSIISND
jgi:hypothetical protein